jgi:hypothetical protein
MGVRALSASENQTAGSADGLMTLPELDMHGQDLSAPGQEAQVPWVWFWCFPALAKK